MFKKQKSNLIFYFFITLAATNVLLLGLAIFKYAGVFNFLNYPLSYSGHAYTLDGRPNTISMYIYSADMFISGAVMFMIASELRNKFSYKNILTILAITATIGFFVAGLAPDDIRHPFHVAGSATFIASLWLMATLFLFRLRNMFGHLKSYLLQSVLQLFVFAYAFAYFLDLDISSIFQKFAVLGLFISLAISSRYIYSEEKNG